MKTTKNPHAVSLGRLGGRVTSPAKAAAVRENGKKGGRPRLTPFEKRMAQIVREHQTAERDLGRDWLTNGCCCGACNIARKKLKS